MYTVENIQDKNTWVVKDVSNKVVASFAEMQYVMRRKKLKITRRG